MKAQMNLSASAILLTDNKGEGMYKDFEDYLMQRCQKENPDVLDDSFPDVFDDWISNLDSDDWIKFAETYAQIKWGEGCEKGSQAVTQTMDMMNKAIFR